MAPGNRLGLVQSTASSGTSKAVEYRMGSAIAIIATKTFSMSRGGCKCWRTSSQHNHPHRYQRGSRRGQSRRGAVPNAMQCRERVSRVFFTRNSRESIRVVAATAISMSPEGMRVPENVLNSTAILVGSEDHAR